MVDTNETELVRSDALSEEQILYLLSFLPHY